MMSGKFICSCFLLFLLQATRSTATLICNKCNSSESVEKCQDVIQCGGKQSCFTEIQTKNEETTYTMGCTDNQNCGEIPEYDYDAVTKLSALSVKNCYECCRSKGCNYNLCKHPKPSKCQDDKRMDCAKLNEMFDICKDIHDAKLVCPNFCNLCRLVDGSWEDWSQWSACDVTCGNGKHTRVRSCTNPAPAYKGYECEGKAIDSKPCKRALCPVHGGWSSWSNWNACPVTCGLGMQKRFRSCSNPYPLRYGDHCFGESVEYNNCVEKLCYDGVWGDWGKWGSCSTSCDNGIRQRSRSCANRVGSICKGNSFEVESCNVQECPCRSPPTLQNGVLKRQSESPFNITYNVECNNGYKSSSLKDVVCNKNSKWPKLPTCNKVSCGKPVAPSNGKLVFSSGITFQAIAIVECCDTCRASGNNVSTCLDNGTWSSSITCLEPVSICTKKQTYNDSFTNVAFGKKVTLSSTYSSTYIAPKMVDGNFERDNVAITQRQRNPFAIVDLEHVYTIYSIYIFNRKDAGYRLTNVHVRLGNTPSSFATIAIYKPVVGVDCTFRFENPVRGRYLKIMLETSGGYLQITELEVYSDTKY